MVLRIKLSPELHDKYRKSSNTEERLALLPFDGFARNYYSPVIKMGPHTRRPFNPVRKISYFPLILLAIRIVADTSPFLPSFRQMPGTWGTSTCPHCVLFPQLLNFLYHIHHQPTCNHLVLVRTPASAFPLAVAFCLHLCLGSTVEMTEAE